MTSTLLPIARNRKRVDTMLLEPYYAKAVERRFAPRARLKRLQRAYVDWDRLLDSLSRGMGSISSSGFVPARSTRTWNIASSTPS